MDNGTEIGSPRSSMTPFERLWFLVRACAGVEATDAQVNEIHVMIHEACRFELPDDNRRLLKLAVNAVAFTRSVREILEREPEIDHREAAVLETVEEMFR